MPCRLKMIINCYWWTLALGLPHMQVPNSWCDLRVRGVSHSNKVVGGKVKFVTHSPMFGFVRVRGELMVFLFPHGMVGAVHIYSAYSFTICDLPFRLILCSWVMDLFVFVFFYFVNRVFGTCCICEAYVTMYIHISTTKQISHTHTSKCETCAWMWRRPLWIPISVVHGQPVADDCWCAYVWFAHSV